MTARFNAPWGRELTALTTIATAAVRPGVMARSWRIWGNGGLFAISGHFSNAALGRYRAFVTDFKRTVVLDTPRGIVVVSPERPDDFVSGVERTRNQR